MKTEHEILALETFVQLIVDSKNKDAALSAFDRNVKKNYFMPEIVEPLRSLFQPIRDQRFKHRQISDIGGVADKIQYSRDEVNQNLRTMKKILSEPYNFKKEDVLLSLLLATGRRTSEVCGATKFLEKEYRGTLKGGNETGQSYYLCSYDLIKKGISFLEVHAWRPLRPSDCNATVAVPLMRRLRSTFLGVQKVHDLRKLHITICVDKLKNSAKIKALKPKERAQIIGQFINQSLGHSNPSSAIPYLNSAIV
jgi:integrase